MSKPVHKSDQEKATSQKFSKSNASYADGDRGVRGSVRAVPFRQGRESGGRHFRSNSGNRGGGTSRVQGRGGRAGVHEGSGSWHHSGNGEWGPPAELTRPQGSAVAVGTGDGGVSRNRYVSANHLLNFSKYDHTRSRGGGGGRFHRGYARRERYNRDEFLQANFRFLVSDAVDVRSFATEADKMFQWDDIVQVEMTVSTPVKCPITLDCPPLAPQITPCGHVFGFSGIMQHMMVSGGRSLRCAAKCPLCFTPIVARELRSVIFHHVEPPSVGSSIRFQLLKRARVSIIPEVVGVPEGTPFNTLQCNRFAKFTTCADGLDVWMKDADELAKSAAQVISEGGLEATLEAPALYTALDSLAGRAKAWTSRRAAKLTSQVDPEEMGAKVEASVRQIFTGRISAVASAQHRERVVKQFDQNFPSLGNKTAAAASERGHDGDLPFLQENESDATGGMELPSSGITMQFGSTVSLGTSPTSHSPPFPKDASDVALGTSPPTSQPASEYFFYQSMDGQWFFLHPANVKCLMMMYGSYERCPLVLEGRIVEIDDMVQGEFLRKRYRNLSHLPNKGSFKLVEVDLGALVPPEFMEPIRQRQEQRRKRAKKEKRSRQRERREAAAAQDAARAPTIEEFRSMPDLSAFAQRSSRDDGDSFDLGFVPQEAENDGGQNSGVSWSAVTKLGFAASWQAPEDSVSTQFPSLPGGGGGALPEKNSTLSQQNPVPKAKNPTNPVWKVENGIASASLKPKQATQQAHPKPVASKKGKKGKTLLFSNSQRRG